MTTESNDGTSSRTLQNVPFASVMSVAYSPDGKRIVGGLCSGNVNGAVTLWNADTGVREWTQRCEDVVTSVAFSPDGTRVAGGTDDGYVDVWNTRAFELERSHKSHQDRVTSIAFSPDSKRIISGSCDKTLHTFGANDGVCEWVLRGHSGGVTSVAFSPDGTHIVSSSYDKTLRLWSAHDGECKQVFKGLEDMARSVAFSSDSEWIVSGSDDGSVKIWSVDGVPWTLGLRDERGSYGVTSVAISPNRDLIASGSRNGVKIWDTDTGTCVRALQGHSDWVNGVAFSPDGTHVASCSDDGSVKVWNVAR